VMGIADGPLLEERVRAVHNGEEQCCTRWHGERWSQ
jgi:hypothetical protein